MALKDRKCLLPVKGAVEIEATLIYTNVNERKFASSKTSFDFVVLQLKAVLRTFNPRQVAYYQTDGKFSVGVSDDSVSPID